MPTAPVTPVGVRKPVNVQEQYTTGTWRNLPNYKCIHCKFATLDELLMKDHIIGLHLKPVPVVRPIEAKLFAADGAQIQTIALAEQPQESPATPVKPSEKVSQPDN